MKEREIKADKGIMQEKINTLITDFYKKYGDCNIDVELHKRYERGELISVETKVSVTI